MKVLLLFAGLAAATSACSPAGYADTQVPGVGGNAGRGAVLVQQYGCGSCHTIPGIRTANGVVGPPLFFFSRRTYIAGQLPNTPENLVRWIREPSAVEPGTAMPDLGLNDQQARDVAAYLYTLR